MTTNTVATGLCNAMIIVNNLLKLIKTFKTKHNTLLTIKHASRL